MSPTVAVLLTAGALTTFLACDVSTPLTPAPAKPATTSTAVDGSTLKVTAPSIVSPGNGETTATPQPTFTVTAVTGQFSNNLGGLTYEFELDDESGTPVDRTFKSDPTWQYPAPLNGDTAYRWKVRATNGSATGPWSSTSQFRTPVVLIATCPNHDDRKGVSDFFFQAAAAVGATVNSVQSRAAMLPAFTKCGMAWQNQSRGIEQSRARFFVGPLNADLFSPWTVDTGNEGGRFNLLFRY
jgi:hypothetical protein